MWSSPLALYCVFSMLRIWSELHSFLSVDNVLKYSLFFSWIQNDVPTKRDQRWKAIQQLVSNFITNYVIYVFTVVLLDIAITLYS